MNVKEVSRRVFQKKKRKGGGNLSVTEGKGHWTSALQWTTLLFSTAHFNWKGKKLEETNEQTEKIDIKDLQYRNIDEVVERESNKWAF